MTTGNSDNLSDAVLTAYLDGELEPAARGDVERRVASDLRIRERVAALTRGSLPFRDAFDLVLGSAPHDRLETALNVAIARSKPSEIVPRRRLLRHAPIAIAASLLLMVGATAGFMIGTAPPTFIGRMFAWDEWQQSVARQVSLYGRKSLAAIEVDPADLQAQLARLGAQLNVDLSAPVVALPGLSLKRADLLQIEDRPLIQLLYDGADTGPVALCIVAELDDDSERARRRIAGMNLVYWTAGGYGFLLVGAAPAETLWRLADVAARRFPG